MTTYGIIGGLGAHAGVDAVSRFNKLSSHTSGEVTDESFPRVLYYQIPFAGVDHEGFTKGGDVVNALGKEISNAGKMFSAAGVSSVMFACNTYSAVADMVFADTGITHFSLHQALEDGSHEHRRTLLLSSRQRAKVMGARPVAKKFAFLNESDQKVVDQVIESTMVHGFMAENLDVLRGILDSSSKNYEVDAAVFACTELSMYFQHMKAIGKQEELRVWDTIERVLVNMMAKG